MVRGRSTGVRPLGRSLEQSSGVVDTGGEKDVSELRIMPAPSDSRGILTDQTPLSHIEVDIRMATDTADFPSYHVHYEANVDRASVIDHT